MRKSMLVAAMIGITTNTVMAHMRKVAYSLVIYRSEKKPDKEKEDKAEQKRIRKQQRNIHNAQP